jgi:nitrate reductase gamma subunit
MKRSVFGFFSLLVVMGFGGLSHGAWLIDATRFHISAHGQIACQDCHDKIKDQPLHPNPLNVGKERGDFFEAETCLACHDEVLGRLDSGFHGKRNVTDPVKYRYCIRCHKPHEQPRLGENRIGTFDPGRPRHVQCGACHEERSQLPPFPTEDRACLVCHLSVDTQDPNGAEQVNALCLHCHAMADTATQKIAGEIASLLDMREYRQVAHAEIACTVCHPEAARYRHQKQSSGDCTVCHALHDEKVAHDAHLAVSCESCHLEGVEPRKEQDSGRILWKRPERRGGATGIHEMAVKDKDALCRRCHFEGNGIGAAAMVLPPKSILCMPCHAATFSAGDTITILSLLVFAAGFVLFFSYWLTAASGASHGSRSEGRAVGKVLAIVQTLFWDVLLQRRLYRLSKGRWLIHSMIYYPFVIRFSWGFLALLGSIWRPEWVTVWPMLDKNHPLTGFVFEVTGVMVIIGLICALIRGIIREGSKERVPGLPGQDRLALGVILGVVVVGFGLEAVRIAMTGWPTGSGYAFVGYLMSLVLPGPPALTSIYGYIWYLHAILTGAFIAYLPFSRLSHMIMAPVVLAMNAAAEAAHHGPAKRGHKG